MNKEDVLFGFDLTHALPEAKILSQKLKDEKFLKDFIANMYELNDDLSFYTLWLPNTGLLTDLPVLDIEDKAYKMLFDNYNPKTFKDCYMRINTMYFDDSLFISEIVELLKAQYSKFKFIFELLK